MQGLALGGRCGTFGNHGDKRGIAGLPMIEALLSHVHKGPEPITLEWPWISICCSNGSSLEAVSVPTITMPVIKGSCSKWSVSRVCGLNRS